MDESDSNFNGTAPPQHLLSDYIEMAYLIIVIILGTPLNIYILIKLFKKLQKSGSDAIKIGFLILKINLNISDLLILLLLAFGKLCWLATYEWKANELACKIFNFLSMLTLYISSNIVVCIALDRFRNVLSASKIRRKSNFVRIIVTVSWILALLWSIPQLYVWETVNVYPEWPGGWIQCSDIWSIEKFKSLQTSDNYYTKIITQDMYNISHLILVFWGPLFLLAICYVSIAVRLLQYSITSPCHQGDNRIISKRVFSKTKMVINDKKTADFRTRGSSDEAEEDEDLAIVRNHENNLQRLKHDRQISSLLNHQPFYCLNKLYHNSKSVASTRNKYSNQQTKLEMREIFVRKKSFSTAVSETHNSSWRKQLRNRVFRTTLLVVIAHILFWFPYNLYALMNYVNVDLYLQMSDHANVFNDLQILITLVNPFLYGFD